VRPPYAADVRRSFGSTRIPAGMGSSLHANDANFPFLTGMLGPETRKLDIDGCRAQRGRADVQRYCFSITRTPTSPLNPSFTDGTPGGAIHWPPSMRKLIW